MISDFDNAMVYFDPQQLLRSSFLRADMNGNNSAACAPELRKQESVAGVLFGTFIFAEINIKNNVLDIVSRNRSIVNAHPELIDALDAYAKEVATFDVDCPGRLGAPMTSNLNDTRARFLDSAGGYWETKGENFGVSDNDKNRLRQIELDSRNTIKALCDAKIAYARALRFTANKKPNTSEAQGYDKLNDELQEDEADAFPIGIQAGWDRVDAALANFPTKDVENACK